jgi:hypothetical protein
MKPSSIIVCLLRVLLVFIAQSAIAQTSNELAVPGCYELKVGPWTPPLGGATQFSTPPDTVKLFADSAYSHPQPGWKRAAPPIHHAYPNGRERVLWTPLESSGFHIVWSDGLTGADMRLYKSHDGYFGIVRMLSDRIGPEATTSKATVVARRVECEDGLP